MNVLAWIRLPTRSIPPDVAPAQPMIDVPKRPGSFRVGGGVWQAKPIAFSPNGNGHLFIADPLLLTPTTH